MSILFIILAACFNALMDATENTPNFNESILKGLDKKFWCKDISWQYAKKVFGWKLDAWHLSKSCMVICVCMAAAPNWWGLALGVIWNIAFVIVYHLILKVQ